MDMEAFVRITEGALQMAVGAVIAAFCTWYFLRRQAPLLPTRESRRMQVLDEVVSQVSSITHTFAKYSTLMQASVQDSGHWPPSRYRELDMISQELGAEFQRMVDAQAKLLMLGEKNLARILRVYSASMIAYTRQVNIRSRDLSTEQINHLKPAIQQAREHFYDVLSRKYDNLLTSNA